MQHLTASNGKIFMKNNTESVEEKDNKVVWNCYSPDLQQVGSFAAPKFYITLDELLEHNND